MYKTKTHSQFHSVNDSQKSNVTQPLVVLEEVLSRMCKKRKKPWVAHGDHAERMQNNALPQKCVCACVCVCSFLGVFINNFFNKAHFSLQSFCITVINF